MTRRSLLGLLLAGVGLPAALLGLRAAAAALNRLSDDEMARIYATPLPPPEGPLRVFHLGHSLVGRDMPAMLQQLAPEGHRHESQLGWGTSLKSHWEPGVPIAGFEQENAHPRYRDAREALESGDYDAVVLTEMVEIRDAIRYHRTPLYLLSWARLARSGNPQARVFLYETWHPLDDPEGWLERLDRDGDRYWDRAILRPALSAAPEVRPILVIPAGQVLARFVRALEGRGGVEGLEGREGLFARDASGALDPIHLNDLGHYLVALVHFAVLYGRDPTGLPHALRRADGSPADPPSPAAARLMQETVWQVVSTTPTTGVAPARS